MENTQQPSNVAAPQPLQPIEWAWISQRQETAGTQASSIWKFGFIAPDGGEVRVTFHQVGNDLAQQEKKKAEQAQQAQQAAMMGMPPSPNPTAFAPAGQPIADATQDATFYVTFFSNRHPEAFMKWDTALNHDESLQTWITITHGIIDFVRKAQPANVILDDLANGKLKMVLRHLAMDVVAGNPAYNIEETKQHHYRTFFQIKKQDVPSAFHAANGDAPQDQPVLQGPANPPSHEGAPAADANMAGMAPAGMPDIPAQDNKPMEGQPEIPDPSKETQPAFPSHDAPQIKKTAPQRKGLVIEIGKDYSVAVKDQDGNAIDRYRAKAPMDILRWINDRGYGGNPMKIVDAELPSKAASKKVVVMTPGAATNTTIKPVVGSMTPGIQEDFTIQGNAVKVNKAMSAKQAALMNHYVNAPQVRCTIESVEFSFETDKDMDLKQVLVQIAYEKSLGLV